ncbi:SDR family NAD(P)-dependent oxidoreductase [Rhizobium sp.]
MSTALLAGKFAVITGAASKRGLGKATAKLFAEHGATVAILDLDEAAAKEAAADLGSQHVGMACNVTDLEGAKAVIAALIAQWGQIDILVNNAGITQPLKIMDIGPSNYDAVLDVNLRGTLYCSQAVIPHMRERKTGKIVNMSSVSAQRGGGIFGGPHYSAAKAGVLGLTKAMARELAPDNVRVNAICPGFIATDITAGMLTPEKLVEIKAGIPMGRPGTADDVAGCALFLASDLSAYVTGSEVDVNGGSLIH